MKVISGAQTGADQAGLYAAQEAGLPTGGHVPINCRTDDGDRPDLIERFGLIPGASRSYVPRTVRNVSESDATIWFGNPNSPGGILTLKTCAEKKKPVLLLAPGNPDAAPTILHFLYVHKPDILNIAGNRERTTPGLFQSSKAALLKAFQSL